MKNPFSKSICRIGLYLVLSISISKGMAQDSSPCKQARMLIKTAKRFHVAPREVDQEFGQEINKQLLKHLDPKGILFTRSQVETLNEAAKSLPGELPLGHCEYLTSLVQLYEQQLLVRDSLIVALVNSGPRIPTQELLHYPDEPIYTDATEMAQRYQQWIFLYVLADYLDQTDSLASLPPPSPTEMAEYWPQVLAREACHNDLKQHYSGGLIQYIGTRYLESIANAFDPHTSYFSSSEKAGFESDLSQESLSYGMELSRNKKGEIEIASIVPGSPAWKSNNLNEGDIVESIRIPGKSKKLFDCLHLSEALTDLNSPEAREATFTIRKPSGKVLEVSLIKSEIEVEENLIQSFILKGSRKIGYLYLPSFFTDFESDGETARKGASHEVATALINLKREGIEALIFDLRGNGGGSMYEAMQIAGMFIDYGAVAMATQRDEEPELLKDQSRGVLFRAPLIVLQNRLSASASELFAATMQDYHRAVIVGDTSYGKATIQQILPVEAYQHRSLLSYSDSEDSQGYVKLTTGAFYRVTGDSHQKMGVSPDIYLPQDEAYSRIGESRESRALPNTTIDKESYYRPLKELPIQTLADLSRLRIQKDEEFMRIGKRSNTASRDHIPLEFEALKEWLEHYSDEDSPSKSSEEVPLPFEVHNPAYLHGLSSLSDAEEQFNQDIIESIETDPYVQEGFYIAYDFLTLDLTKE